MSYVANDSRPSDVDNSFTKHFLISSTLKRAVHSAEIYTGRKPDMQLSILNEMDIPRYKLPFKLNAWAWVYLNRVLWMLGVRGRFESYREARKRSFVAANKLIELVRNENRVVVFGHGYMNYHLRKVLIKHGWRLVSKSSDFFGGTRLTR